MTRDLDRIIWLKYASVQIRQNVLEWCAMVYSYELSSLPGCVCGQPGAPNSWCSGCACRYERRALRSSADGIFGV